MHRPSHFGLLPRFPYPRSSKYVEKFSEFCCDNDILVEMFPLEAIGDTGMVG